MEDPLDVPWPVVEHLAEQIQVADPSWGPRSIREKSESSISVKPRPGPYCRGRVGVAGPGQFFQGVFEAGKTRFPFFGYQGHRRTAHPTHEGPRQATDAPCIAWWSAHHGAVHVHGASDRRAVSLSLARWKSVRAVGAGSVRLRSSVVKLNQSLASSRRLLRSGSERVRHRVLSMVRAACEFVENPTLRIKAFPC